MKALEGVRILDMSHVQAGPIFRKLLAGSAPSTKNQMMRK